jgi:hypothetical protein
MYTPDTRNVRRVNETNSVTIVYNHYTVRYYYTSKLILFLLILKTYLQKNNSS